MKFVLIYSRTAVFLLSTILWSFSPATAQVNSASLSGLIVDANGAAIPGARVVVENGATKTKIETASGADGYYGIGNLRPGTYAISVDTAGFKRETRLDVQISIGQRARLDFFLTVGQHTESVTITAESLLLQRDDASVGQVVNNSRIMTLPLPQRSWDDLLMQIAGTQGDPYTEQAGGTASGRTGAINIHGSQSLSNNFILDGQDNNSISTNVQELSTQVSRPSLDAIGEFKVITSQYSAETGRSAGGVISVMTKSGTSQFRGLVYEYLRNKVFDANDFFSNRVGRPKPQRIQNQFGGNLGGPILRDRIFFFADYEGTRIRQSVLRIASVPLNSEKAGNFSATLGNEIVFNGQRVPILNPDGTPTGQFVRQGQLFDPRTQVPNPMFNSAQPASPLNPLFIRQPFTGNIINNIDPVAARLAAIYPPPILPGRSNNFARSPSVQDDVNRFITRIDYRNDTANEFYGRYAFTERDRFVPGFFGGVADGTDTSAWGKSDIRSHSLVINWTRIVSSRIINELRFAYSKVEADTVHEPFGVGTTSDFVPGIPDNKLVQGGVPAIVIIGFSPRLGSPDFLPKFQHSQQFQYANTLSWTSGAHAVRIGADAMMPLKLDYLDVPNTRGRLVFEGSYTQFGGGLPGTGSPLADFLVGAARNAALSNVVAVNQRRFMYSFFGQDYWKASRDLTISLGLRYDFGSPAYERNNRIANFDPAAASSASTNAQALASLRLATNGDLTSRALVRPDHLNLAPRVGVVYSPHYHWVIRAGYGIYYNLLDRLGSEDQLSLNPPFLVNFNFTSNTITPAATFTTGFPSNALDPSTVNLTQVQLRAVNQLSRSPYLQQYGLNIQHQFGKQWLAEVGYVGTRGTHLPTLRDLNQPLPGQTSLARAQRFPYPRFGLIEYRDDNGISRYDSMEARVERRFGTDYSIHAVYTFSKSLDNSFENLTTGGSNAFPQNARDLHSWYGLSDFDVRHRFVFSGIWDLPFGHDRRFANSGFSARLFGDWKLAATLNTRTGRPFTVTQAGDPLSLGVLSVTLPDLIGDPRISSPTVERWFNAAAFRTLNTNTNRFGSEGRNTLVGPSFASLDFAIHRRFGFWGEDRYMDFRWEVFNALNRANFGLPNRVINSADVGTVTTLAGDPRVMQFALRFQF
jgi:hypothetical protein